MLLDWVYEKNFFMKTIFPILFLIAIQSFGQDYYIEVKSDTLIIKQTKITTYDPFQFGSNPKSTLEKLKFEKTFRTYENVHVENKIDTLFTFQRGGDLFEVFKSNAEENWLVGAIITTRNFSTSKKLQIGVSKADVVSRLSDYKINNIPTYLILEDLEIPERLIFTFSNQRITKIEYIGYYD